MKQLILFILLCVVVYFAFYNLGKAMKSRSAVECPTKQ